MQLDDSDRDAEKVIDETPIKEKLAWLRNRHAELRVLEAEVIITLTSSFPR